MQIVAHRGASALEPENTLQAFARALDDGAEAVEFDVRLTADRRLVVMHDDDTKRTCGVEGRISAMTFADVQELNAAAVAWPGRTAAVPSFEQVVALLAGKVTMFVEVKGAWTGTEYLPAADVLDEAAALLEQIPDLVLSSFDVAAVVHARTLFPDRATGLGSLTGVDLAWTLATASEHGIRDCHVPQEQIEEAFIADAHAAGKRVLGWTVNGAQRARELRDFGCDGIFTDDPGAMRELLV